MENAMKINSKCIWAVMAMITCGSQSADATAPAAGSAEAWHDSKMYKALDKRLTAAKWQDALCNNNDSATNLLVAEHDIKLLGLRFAETNPYPYEAHHIAAAGMDTELSAFEIAEKAKSLGLSSELQKLVVPKIDGTFYENCYEIESAIAKCITDEPPSATGNPWTQLIQKMRRRANNIAEQHDREEDHRDMSSQSTVTRADHIAEQHDREADRRDMSSRRTVNRRWTKYG
jgi:hypothetical protein